MRGIFTREQIAVLSLIFGWVLLTLWNLGLPGLYFDEVNHFAFIPGLISEEAAKLHHYRIYDNWLDYQNNTLRYPILGGSFYNTTIRPYVSIPYFLVSGYSTETLRIFTALIGLSAMLSLTWLVKRMFGLLPAAALGIMLALDTNDVFSLRAQGGLFWFVIFFLAISGHCLLSASRNPDSSRWYAMLGGASVSLAVLCYFIGAFIALPMIVCALFVYRKRLSYVAIYIISGLLAYSPVIYAVVSAYLKKPESLRSYGMPRFAQTAQSTGEASDSARMLEVLQGTFVDATYARSIVGPGIAEFPWTRIVAIGIILIALLTTAIKLLRSKRDFPEREHLAFYLVLAVSALVYGTALLSLKSINHHHLIPFHAFFLAAASSLIATKGWMRPPVVLALLLLSCTSLFSTISAQGQLRKNGGMGFHNEMVTLPAKVLPTAFRDYHPVFVSWGFHLQYLFLTEGKSPYTFMGKPVPDRIEAALRKYGKLAIVVSASDRAQLLKSIEQGREYKIHSRKGTYLYSIVLASSKSDAAAHTDMPSKKPSEPESFPLLSVVPNPVDFCTLDTSVVEVRWNVSNSGPVVLQIYVEDSAGKRTLWSAPAGKVGSDFTGEWVQRGSRFIAVDAVRKVELAAVDVAAKPCQ